jgi:hypothetical protein
MNKSYGPHGYICTYIRSLLNTPALEMSLSALELEELRVAVFSALVDYGNMLRDARAVGGSGGNSSRSGTGSAPMGASAAVSEAMQAVVASTMEIAQSATSLLPQFAGFVVEIGKYYAYVNEFERARTCFQYGLNAADLMGMEQPASSNAASASSLRDLDKLRLQVYLSLAYVCKELE